MSAALQDEPKICYAGGKGVVFPISQSEQDWPRGLRIVLYLLGLSWTFMGVAMIADVFMGAIEKVTSKKMRRFNAKKNRWYTYEVWNPTVANLTLMALGSSAPEILLNVIDIFAKDFFLEGLGPSTIVGSAAFNLLMIIAVCIVAIPEDQVRTIKETSVYFCTASWSVFAYIWLIIILLVSSPHVVEVWEGVVTFAFFPLLTFLAFACDKGWIVKKTDEEDEKPKIIPEMTEEEFAKEVENVRKCSARDLSDDEMARIMLALAEPRKSKAFRRVEATRNLCGGKKLKVGMLKKSLSSLSFLGRGRSGLVQTHPAEEEEEKLKPVCTFAHNTTRYAVLENAQRALLTIKRTGDITIPAKVSYKTIDGTAVGVPEAADSTKGEYAKNGDFVHVQGELEFKAGVKEMVIPIKIIDDAAYEEDENFFLELTNAQAEGGKFCAIDPDFAKAEIVIIDDDQPGIVVFPEEEMVLEVQREDWVVHIPVERKCGANGEVTVKFRTEGDSAQPTVDFEETEGEAMFENGCQKTLIPITLKGSFRYQGTRMFRLILEEPSNQAKFDVHRDGGAASAICTIRIQPGAADVNKVEKSWTAVRNSFAASQVGHRNWRDQFVAAMSVTGCDEDADDPGMMDYLMHFVGLPWKLLFAVVPPTDYADGWMCFCVSLGMIGVVTMFIGDLASLLGCVMDIPDDITAITFVALGTSLPDTFASKTAAVQDDTADASVGNVTGSNSVNVFLGLGLPWMIASIAWHMNGSTGARAAKWEALYQNDAELTWLGAAGSRPQAFVVKAGTLAFSVTVFTICALACLVLLQVRRVTVGGELGGKSKAVRWGSAGFLCFLWLLYIGLSSWKSLSLTA